MSFSNGDDSYGKLAGACAVQQHGKHSATILQAQCNKIGNTAQQHSKHIV
jgi:hypothetical protein